MPERPLLVLLLFSLPQLFQVWVLHAGVCVNRYYFKFGCLACCRCMWKLSPNTTPRFLSELASSSLALPLPLLGSGRVGLDSAGLSSYSASKCTYTCIIYGILFRITVTSIKAGSRTAYRLAEDQSCYRVFNYYDLKSGVCPTLLWLSFT